MAAFTTQQSGKYRRFGLSDAVPFGQRPRTAKQEYVKQYSTNFLGRATANHVRRAPLGTPLLTVFAPYAPHSPFTATRKYRGSGAVPADYFNASVLEQDVSDKPGYIKELPRDHGRRPGTGCQSRKADRHPAQRQRPGPRHLRCGSHPRGRLDRTLFIYVSDNGYLHGEHRLEGKGYPYLKSTNVPLVMRWGAGAPGTVDDRLTVANVDVHASILQAAGLANTSAGTSVLADRNQRSTTGRCRVHQPGGPAAVLRLAHAG